MSIIHKRHDYTITNYFLIMIQFGTRFLLSTSSTSLLSLSILQQSSSTYRVYSKRCMTTMKIQQPLPLQRIVFCLFVLLLHSCLLDVLLISSSSSLSNKKMMIGFVDSFTTSTTTTTLHQQHQQQQQQQQQQPNHHNENRIQHRHRDRTSIITRKGLSCWEEIKNFESPEDILNGKIIHHGGGEEIELIKNKFVELDSFAILTKKNAGLEDRKDDRQDDIRFVLGSSGSGKTFFSVKVAATDGIAHSSKYVILYVKLSQVDSANLVDTNSIVSFVYKLLEINCKGTVTKQPL